MSVVESSAKSPSVTVAVTRHAEPTWLLLQTLDSLATQEGVRGEVLVLDQRPDQETAERVRSFAGGALEFRLMPIPPGGLSSVRNLAIRHARYPLVLFLDSDAIADRRWSAELARTFDDDGVAVAGSRILPRWHRRPLAIARASLALEQYSVLDHGDGEMRVAKVIGAGFGIHVERLGRDARFDEHLGRQAGLLLGGEETDLCVRARAAGLQVHYNGRSIVHHQVLPERISYRWLWRRIFYSGFSRAVRGGAPAGTHRSTAWDLVFLPVILPPYAIGYLQGLRQRGRVPPDRSGDTGTG